MGLSFEKIEFNKLGFVYHLNHSKVKACDSANFYNQTFNSHAAVFESFLREARERLAKQDARARTRSSSGAFAGECAEQLIESRKLSTAAWRSRGYRGIPPVLLFFCRRFLFQIKRKCRNAGSVKSLIIVGREGSKPIINNLQLLRPCIGCADSGQPQGLSLRLV